MAKKVRNPKLPSVWLVWGLYRSSFRSSTIVFLVNNLMWSIRSEKKKRAKNFRLFQKPRPKQHRSPSNVSPPYQQVPAAEAYDLCRYDWMRQALDSFKERLSRKDQLPTSNPPEFLELLSKRELQSSAAEIPEPSSLYILMPSAAAEHAIALCWCNKQHLLDPRTLLFEITPFSSPMSGVRKWVCVCVCV